MELTAKCKRSGQWWTVRVPEIRGLFTQTRRLDQVEEWVLDAASMLGDQPSEGYVVTVVPELEDDTLAVVTSVKEARERLRTSEKEAAVVNREAVKQLADQGLTVRDIGMILDVSPQRAHKLLKAA
ncbi:MAG: hypothetical protein FWG08_03455 [Propionibacteriaceae bacterium]|nr:hypothetical protein [Propionibacteriaceae bacterium]